MAHLVTHIKEHEAALDRMQQLVERMNTVVMEWEQCLPEFKKLMAYYGSEQWHEDVQASNEGALEGVKCGVLSQDAVYNLYAEQRALHFKMMRLALDYLES